MLYLPIYTILRQRNCPPNHDIYLVVKLQHGEPCSIIVYIVIFGGLILTNESIIALLESKLQVFKNGYIRAHTINDLKSVAKWKKGYNETLNRIKRLKEE